MKTKALYLWGIILLVSLLMIPSFSVAATKENNSPRVLIQYFGKPTTCQSTRNDQVNVFGWGGWKLQSGLTDYRINYSTMPSYLSRGLVTAIFDLSFSALQGAGGGILFSGAGSSTESAPSNNGQNTIMWKTLPASYVAVTYIWVDGNSRLAGADTIFNSRYRWSYANYTGSNDCGGSKSTFDLRNIATHEFGHWMGLGDLYNLGARDLTMYGYASRGELKKDTLGLGDITGARAVWP